jgi:hypothetical protein
MLLVIDEAPVFLRMETTKEELMRAVNQWRILGIYILFAAQRADMLPNWVLTQSRYTFCANNIDTQSLVCILKAYQKADFHPSFTRDVSDTIRGMRTKANGEREWYMVDGILKEETIFFPYPPLSEHLEETG